MAARREQKRMLPKAQINLLCATVSTWTTYNDSGNQEPQRKTSSSPTTRPSPPTIGWVPRTQPLQAAIHRSSHHPRRQVPLVRPPPPTARAPSTFSCAKEEFRAANWLIRKKISRYTMRVRGWVWISKMSSRDSGRVILLVAVVLETKLLRQGKLMVGHRDWFIQEQLPTILHRSQALQLGLVEPTTLGVL